MFQQFTQLIALKGTKVSLLRGVRKLSIQKLLQSILCLHFVCLKDHFLQSQLVAGGLNF